MNPHEQVCHNPRCWVYGAPGEGHIVIHSRRSGGTNASGAARPSARRRGRRFYRLHKPHELVVRVVTLLAYGCPVQAIVAAFGLDERTVADWQRRAGRSAERVHEHLVAGGSG